MKALLVLTVFVAVTYANNVHLSKSQKEKVQQYTLECMKQSGVKPEVLAEAKKQNFKDDDGLKKFMLCFFQKTGIMDRDGRLNVDVALSKLPQDADKAGVKKALEECRTKKGRDVADTAFEIESQSGFKGRCINKACEPCISDTSSLAKIRYVTVLCLIFALECACEEIIQLEPEKTAKVLESAIKCTAKHGVNLDVLERLRSKERTKDEKFLKFLYCTLEDLKVVKKNGYYIEDEALKFVPKRHKALVRKALEECNREPGKDHIDVLYNVSRCLEDKSNVRVTI